MMRFWVQAACGYGLTPLGLPVAQKLLLARFGRHGRGA